MHTYYIMRLLYLNVPLIHFRVKCEKILTLKQKNKKTKMRSNSEWKKICDKFKLRIVWRKKREIIYISKFYSFPDERFYILWTEQIVVIFNSIAILVFPVDVQAQFSENMAQNMMMMSLLGNNKGGGSGMNPFLMMSLLGNSGGAKMDKLMMLSLLNNGGGGGGSPGATAARG